ncbi:putative cell survival pathways protein [Agyrium rufum]|nr:putative cell survival pathways protein [Agyrium rufum]
MANLPALCRVANVAGTQEPIYGPSALQSVAEQAKTTPYTETTKRFQQWEAMESTNVETQTFYLTADSNKIPTLWSSNPLDNIGFDDEHYSFYADGCAVELNDAGDEYTIKSAVNEASIVNLKIKRVAPGFVVGENGNSHFGTDHENPWGTMRHVFWIRCETTGTIVTKDGEIDFTGRAMLSHALQGMKPHHAEAAKWDFINFQSPSYSATLMKFITPPSYGTSIVSIGGIIKDSEIITAGADTKVTHTRIKHDEQNDWPEPEAVKWEWFGKTKDGKNVTAKIEGDLGQRLEKVDIMAEVPGFIKSIVGGVVGTKPYIYQYSPQTRLKLIIDIDGQETQEEGTVYAETTFIS